MSRVKVNKRKSSKRRTTKRTKGRSTISYKPSPMKKIKVLLIFIFLIGVLYYLIPDSITLTVGIDEYKKDEIKEIVREVLQEENSISTEENSIVEEPKENTDEIAKVEEEKIEVTSRGNIEPRNTNETVLTGYRITSYHPGDNCASGTKTGSGKTINNFQTMKIGNKDVYTYKGKIVVAAATEELLKSRYNVKGGGTRQEGKHYFRYYDELQLQIDGKWYDCVVLDSCGASMWSGEFRVDIYVPSASNVINRSNVSVKI